MAEMGWIRGIQLTDNNDRDDNDDDIDFQPEGIMKALRVSVVGGVLTRFLKVSLRDSDLLCFYAIELSKICFSI